MNKKYTFVELCDSYHKIEIPIIQRDYAQGRETDDVKRIRTSFIDGFLIPSLLENTSIELDFVYGSILTEIRDEFRIKTFIPLDGQQRLTTLYLLHYFLAIKENKLPELRPVLAKFTYETRPSAHDFCQRLLAFDEVKNLQFIRGEIEDAVWFNDEWLNDPTVAGMLKIIDTFASNQFLRTNNQNLVAKLLDKETKLISFYFTDLEQFGLTESLYIRMNARGKMLTDFENFKSEFFKIIRYNNSLLEIVKDKIEYDWVDNLWDYREDKAYVIDQPFMKYLHFITEMLYYKDAQYRSATTYEAYFLDFKVLASIYSKEENLTFLIFSLDYISNLKKHDFGLLWGNNKLLSLKDILADVIKNNNDIDKGIILFSAIAYTESNRPQEYLVDYLRVVRNLIVNTDDNSRREWPRLLLSIQSLSTNVNVYELLANNGTEISLIGFNLNQRKEEIFKARLITALPNIKGKLSKIEDHPNLKGDITNFLITPFIDSEVELVECNLDDCSYDDESSKFLIELLGAYNEVSKGDFSPVWGNFLNTGLYGLSYQSRLTYSTNFKKHPAVLAFTKKYLDSKKTLANFVFDHQQHFIKDLELKNEELASVRDVKEQLYLYYIIHEQVYHKSFNTFFKNNNFNFGWLAKDIGYKSHFSNGIEGCRYFPNHNPIFQLYNSQFRYNSGLNKANTLDIEMVGVGKKRDPFTAVLDWANN